MNTIIKVPENSTYNRHSCVVLTNNTCNANIGIYLSVNSDNKPSMTAV